MVLIGEGCGAGSSVVALRRQGLPWRNELRLMALTLKALYGDLLLNEIKFQLSRPRGMVTT